MNKYCEIYFFWCNTPSTCLTLFCFTIFCVNVPFQLTTLLNLRSLIFRYFLLVACFLLRKSFISDGNVSFDLCFFDIRRLLERYQIRHNARAVYKQYTGIFLWQRRKRSSPNYTFGAIFSFGRNVRDRCNNICTIMTFANICPASVSLYKPQEVLY